MALKKRHYDDLSIIDTADDSERFAIEVFAVNTVSAAFGLANAGCRCSTAGLNIGFRHRPLSHAPNRMDRQEKVSSLQSSDDCSRLIAHKVLT